MAKTKKSRKIGQIGVRKSNEPRRPSKAETGEPTAKSNKHKGNKSGTRQQLAESVLQNARKAKVDPKVGSKKPINLDAYKSGSKNNVIAEKQSEVSYKSPQEELEAIENNLELETLLEKQVEHDLTKAEQAFVSKMTTRYRDLCVLLGIDTDDSAEDSETDSEFKDDPFAQLDAIKIDDFKD